MDSVAVAMAANSLHHEWPLPGVLVVFVIALFQAGYIVLSKKHQHVTASYLAIREVLAGTFRTALLREVRAVFQVVEQYLPAALIEHGPDLGPSRFQLLLDGLAPLVRQKGQDDEVADQEDRGDKTGERDMYEIVLRDALTEAVVSRFDALISEAERATTHGAPGSARQPLSISFAESTVEDLVYLARALHLTRKHQTRFYTGRLWAQRFLVALLIAFALLMTAMLITASWGYWLAIGALTLFAVTGVGSLISSYVALRAVNWLEEKAQAPDTDNLFRNELGT